MLRISWQTACAALAAGAIVFLVVGAGQSASPEPARTPSYKTVFVPAKFEAAAAPEVPTTPDGDKLRQDVDSQLKTLAKDGFEVVQVVPIEKGVYKWNVERQSANTAFGMAYGFGVTNGVMIVAVKH